LLTAREDVDCFVTMNFGSFVRRSLWIM